MKEIDLLPDWYKSDRRRKISYRTQYVALVGILVLIIVWNFIATHSISKATAELAQMSQNVSITESTSAKLTEIKTKVVELQKKLKSIEEIDSKIDVASTLAEMSFLIDEKVVLSRVELNAEKFVNEQKQEPPVIPLNVARAAGAQGGGNNTPWFGNVRFKVVIGGVAADASNVAALICKLEDSPYFCQVIPSFSRNRKIKQVSDLVGDNYQVSEFEITCYLANYRVN